MKRFLLFLLALATYSFGMSQNYISFPNAFAVDDVDIEPGGTATVVLKLTQLATDEGVSIRDGQFELLLPEGITIKYDDEEDDYCVYMSSVQNKNYAVTFSKTSDQHFQFLYNNSRGKSLVVGDVIEIVLEADANAAGGEATVCGDEGVTSPLLISGRDAANAAYNYAQDPFTFNIVVCKTLDENKEGGYEAFAAYTGKVKVNRTISAGNWNTICLPLSMTVAQVKTAFGSDVQLATFSGCTPSKNKNNDVTGLNLHFASVSLNGADNTEVFQANTPYLIKVETAVTEPFTLDPATITEITDGTPTATGTGGSFIGTYKYISALGSEEHPYMFMSGNTFYTAIGNTKMKPFRAYFDLDDLAAYRAYRNSHSSANVNIFVDDEQVTGIDGVTIGQGNVDAVYDLQGRLVKVDGDLNNLEKGIYIINGQKVTVK